MDAMAAMAAMAAMDTNGCNEYKWLQWIQWPQGMHWLGPTRSAPQHARREGQLALWLAGPISIYAPGLGGVVGNWLAIQPKVTLAISLISDHPLSPNHTSHHAAPN
jgi:hypothetical protein